MTTAGVVLDTVKGPTKRKTGALSVPATVGVIAVEVVRVTSLKVALAATIVAFGGAES